jgi:hypothetical protein
LALALFMHVAPPFDHFLSPRVREGLSELAAQADVHLSAG